MSQVSEAETVPGDLPERLDSCPSGGHATPVEDSQPQRALWTRPAAPPALVAPLAAPAATVPARPRTYRSLRPHMQLLPQRSFALPRSILPRGATGPAREMQYIPVSDSAEGLSYMMCSYCKGDRIYRVFQNFLRHLESGECPAGQYHPRLRVDFKRQELLRLRAQCDTPAAPPLPVPHASQEPPRPPPAIAAVSQPESWTQEEPLETDRFRCRRALLAELRLLQPKRYAELAVDALGLLNRSIQDLLLLLQRAREDPELSSRPADDSGKALAPSPAVKTQVQRHPVEALTDRLKGQGVELRPIFSFEQCRSEFYLREAKLLARDTAASASQLRRRAPKRPCEESQGRQLVPVDVV